MADAFSEHFQKLATPSNSPDYDIDYETKVTFDKLLIETIASQQGLSHNPVTLKEIRQIINSFRNNKAQDPFGLSAEHLKLAPEKLHNILVTIMNRILDTGYIPAQLKEGILTPVLKKKKDATLPTNYRGITVLSILGKILERVLLNRTKGTIEKDQSKFQRGFTNKSSAVNAALTVSEAQNEAKNTHSPLRMVTLYAKHLMWCGRILSGFKFNFFDSLLKLASGIIFHLLNLPAYLLFHTCKHC